MADINVGINRTNDPSYLGNSQGTDRASLQPLATVPDLSTKYVQPDYQANKTAGTALKGLGDLGEAAVKLTDAVIQKKADDTLTEGINKIRDSFGVGAAQSGDVAQAVGQAGAEGVSLSDANSSVNQPVALNRLGNRIEGLTEQYNQGGLSNSAYYAKLEAFVRQTKTQFPGYGNEIDSMVATKVGTTPANALRGALLQDVTQLQGKVQAQNDKWTTYERGNAGDIYNIWPNYDQRKPGVGDLSRAQVEAEVGKRQARSASIDADSKALALKGAQNADRADSANDLSLRIGSKISNETVIGMTNSMGINNADDLRKYITDVQTGKRPAPSADEQAQVTGLFATLKQKAEARFNAEITRPLNSNTTETLASVLRSPEKIAAAKKIALADISDIEDGLLNDKHGVVAATVQWNKATDAIADKKLSTNMPNADLAGAVRRKMGDQTLSQLIVSPATGAATDIMAGLRQAGWTSLDKGESALSTIGGLSKDDPSGVASKQYIRDATHFIINRDKLADPSLSDNTFKSLYGEGNRTLIDAYNRQPGSQVGIFQDMVSPQVTKAIHKRSAADQKVYTNFAEEGFTSVFQTQANGVNTAANAYKLNNNLKLVFDPETNNFSYKGSMTTPSAVSGSATRALEPLNSAINTMKPVLAMTGKNPTQFLHDKLIVMGIEPGTPLYQALDSAMPKEPEK